MKLTVPVFMEQSRKFGYIDLNNNFYYSFGTVWSTKTFIRVLVSFTSEMNEKSLSTCLKLYYAYNNFTRVNSNFDILF